MSNDADADAGNGGTHRPGSSGAKRLPATQACRYCAFISYRHGGRDGQIAAWLAKAIERYRLPRSVIQQYGLPARVGRVFRDEEELPTSSSLSDQIEQALRASRFLVVLCSPRLQHSKWCRREIELFQALRGRGHMLAVLVDGDPSNIGGAEDPFPPEVRYPLSGSANGESDEAASVEDEPIAADFRRSSGLFGGEVRRRALLRIIAGLVGCNFDDLYERDKRRERSKNLTLGTIGIFLVCILAALGIWGLRSKVAIATAQSAILVQTDLRRWTAYVEEMKRLAGLWQSNRTPDIRRILDDAAPDLRGVEWYAWDRRLREDLGIIFTADDASGISNVRCLAISPDHRFLAAISAASYPSKPKSLIILWDIQTRKIVQMHPIPGHFNQTDEPGFDSTLAFSPDGKLIGACSYVGTSSMQDRKGSLWIWDVETGKQRLAILNDDRVGGRSITFSPDSASIVAGGFDSGWLAWNIEAGAAAPPIVFSGDRRSKYLLGPGQKPVRDKNAVFDLRFYLWDKRHIVSASPGSVPTIREWPGNDRPARGLGFGVPRDEHLPGVCYVVENGGSPLRLSLVGGRIEMIPFKDAVQTALNKESPVSSVIDAPGKIRCLHADPRGDRHLLAGCGDGTIRLYTLPINGETAVSETVEYHGLSHESAVTMDDKWVAGAGDRSIRLWPLRSSTTPVSLSDDSVPSAQSNKSAGSQGRFAGSYARSMVGGQSKSYNSPSGHFAGDWDPERHTFTVQRDTDAKPAIAALTNQSAPLAVTYSPHERFVAISCGNMHIVKNGVSINARPIPGELANGQVFDLQSGRQVISFTSNSHWVHAFSFSDDETLCVAGMANAGARVYHTDTGKLDIELTGVDASITKMSRSGRYVAAGNARNFGVFDRVRGSWIIHDFVRVEMVSFDPWEKRVFLAGSRGDSMQVRDLETGLQLPTVFETAGSKFFVFSTDGRRAYAMAGAKRLNVYDAATGTVMAEIPCEGFPNNPDGFESLLLEQLNHK